MMGLFPCCNQARSEDNTRCTGPCVAESVQENLNDLMAALEELSSIALASRLQLKLANTCIDTCIVWEPTKEQVKCAKWATKQCSDLHKK